VVIITGNRENGERAKGKAGNGEGGGEKMPNLRAFYLTFMSDVILKTNPQSDYTIYK
jgi:hypothetical protein